MLPFGAGQFQTCRYWQGALFATFEGLMLQTWYSKKQEADAAVTALNEYQRQYKQAGMTSPHSEEDDAHERTYVDDVTTYAQDTQRKANTALYLFVAIWGGGIADAFLNAPKPEKEKDEEALHWRPVLGPHGGWGVAMSLKR